MRRVTGLVAAALGTFLIVLAVLTRFSIAHEVVKFPLDENSVTTLTAPNVTYFNTGLLQPERGVSMTETSTTQGDVAAGSAHTAVWNNFTYLYDNTNQQTFSYSLRRLAFDRRSGQLVNCACGEAIDGKKAHFSGLGYVWPLNAQKQTYEIFDSTLMKPEPVSFAGTETVHGLRTYKYVENVPATQFTSQTLPGSLVGMAQQTVQLGEFYAGTATYWVDPITGAPVQVGLSEHLYLAGTSGSQVLDLLDGTFTTTPASVASAVSTSRHYDAEIAVISLVIPATAAIAGVIILIMGIILGRQRRGYDYADEAVQNLAGAPG